MDGRQIMRQMDEWQQQSAARRRDWKAAGRTVEAMAAIYTPDVCAECGCESPAEAMALDSEILADAWLWEHRDDKKVGDSEDT